MSEDRYNGLDIDEQIIAHLATPGSEKIVYHLEPDMLSDDAADALLAWLEYEGEYGSAPPPEILADQLGLDGFDEPVGEPGYWLAEVLTRQLRKEGTSALRKAGKLGQSDPVAAFEFIREESDRLLKMARPTARDVQAWGSDGGLEWYRTRLAAMLGGVTIGFPEIDMAMGGIAPGFLVTVLARLKRYKSWLLQKSAVETMLGGKRVTFAPLEMPEGEFMWRVDCMLAQVSWQKSVERRLTAEDLMALENIEMWHREQPNPIHIVRPHYGQRNAATLAKMAVDNGSDVLYVDQLDSMDRDTNQSDWLEMGRNAQELKEAAMEHGIAVVLAHQMNRQGVVKKFVDLGAEVGARADKVGQVTDILLASFATGQMKKNRIIHFGVLESRQCESPRAWEIKVDLDEATDFRWIAEHDIHEDEEEGD